MCRQVQSIKPEPAHPLNEEKSVRLLEVVSAGLLLYLLPHVAAGGEVKATVSTAERICGTWVLQQVSSRNELERLVPTTISPALKTPHIRGFSLRVPWKAVDQDFSLLEAGRDIARDPWRWVQRPFYGGTAHTGACVRQRRTVLSVAFSTTSGRW